MATCKGCILAKIQPSFLSSLNIMPHKQNTNDYVLRYKHWECPYWTLWPKLRYQGKELMLINCAFGTWKQPNQTNLQSWHAVFVLHVANHVHDLVWIHVLELELVRLEKKLTLKYPNRRVRIG